MKTSAVHVEFFTLPIETKTVLKKFCVDCKWFANCKFSNRHDSPPNGARESKIIFLDFFRKNRPSHFVFILPMYFWTYSVSLLLRDDLRRNIQHRCLIDILQPPTNLLQFIFSHVIIELIFWRSREWQFYSIFLTHKELFLDNKDFGFSK